MARRPLRTVFPSVNLSLWVRCMQTILIVDDDPVQRRLLEAAISRIGIATVTAPGGGPALDLLFSPKGEQISLMVLDLMMPDIDGMQVLTKLRAVNQELPVIVLTAKGGIDSAVEAMRAGANDFLVKPASPERIKVSIRNVLKLGALSGEVTRLKKKQQNLLVFDDLIARSPAMRQVIRLGTRASQSSIPILIEGESGVGKELVARAIQGGSERAGKPFVTVNCGAIPENLIESILFGHEKGAFTGATDKHLGKFQEADGGTLFLDEIGELRLDMQVKLLRALQERRDRSGRRQAPGEGRCPHHLRHQSRPERAHEGRQIPRGSLLPPERVSRHRAAACASGARTSPRSSEYFVTRFAAEENKHVAGFTPEALELLNSYSLARQCAAAGEHGLPRRGAVRRRDARRRRFPADRRCDGDHAARTQAAPGRNRYRSPVTASRDCTPAASGQPLRHLRDRRGRAYAQARGCRSRNHQDGDRPL